MRNRPANFVADNLGWMLISLILAVIVWYAAVSAQNPVEQRRLSSRIPINLIKDNNLMIVNTPPDTVLVTVRAPRSVWDVLEPEDISVVADLSSLGPGVHTIQIKATMSDARRGVITDIQPSQITVDLARRMEALVPIDIIRTAEPPPGLTSTPTLSDPNAKITGPEALVKQVVSAQARISLQDRRTRFSQSVHLVPVDANNKEVTGVTVVPADLTVNIDIQPRPDVTELTVAAQLTGTLPTGYRRRNYYWDPQTVVVRGERTTIDAMNGVVSTEPIDLTGRTQTFSQRVKLLLPAGVTLVDPTDVNVTIEIEAIQGSREFDNIPVQPQGLDPADYAITIQPQTVNVIVNGPQPVLETMTGNDITVTAPLAGLSAGNKHQVTLQASVTKAGINNTDVVIPNARAEVTIIARHPTATPTQGPTPPTPEPATALMQGTAPP